MIQNFAKSIYKKLDKYPQFREKLTVLYATLSSTGNRYKIKGKNNQIIARGSILKNVTFDILGDNNSISINSESNICNVLFFVRGSNHQISIGKRCKFNRGSTIWFEDHNCILSIGNSTSIEEAHIALTEPYSKITIGVDCMIAYDVDIRCGDSHSIIDLETQNRLNHAKDIEIGDHVWIAAHTRILKGVSVGENSVVAIGAIVTKNVDSNVIVAGNPAKSIKTQVTWNRQRIYE